MSKQDIYRDDDFARDDEKNDGIFYHRPRMVHHLDAVALATVERLYGSLIVEEEPAILDLMASFDSHLPVSVVSNNIIGLGLNQEELRMNRRLSDFVLHDLNRSPEIPFKDESFDVVLNSVSVDYLTSPEAVFTEVARLLRPGGLFLVVFSNRWFEPKVTNIWRRASEPERVWLVEHWFQQTGSFHKPRVYVSKGKDRPGDDKYASIAKQSDPIYAVFADRKGGSPLVRNLPEDGLLWPEPAELARRKSRVGQTLECPYCLAELRKWEVPQTPFTEWPNEFFYVCFNDHCPFFEGGWSGLTDQGNVGWSHRLTYDAEKNVVFSLPVQTRSALRESIVG